ncbi:MAG: glycosyltransferase [Pseudomonadota bacterium]
MGGPQLSHQPSRNTAIEDYAVAVIIPCKNEEAAIADVVAGFRAVLPSAAIVVFDNASSDNTADVAAAAGAIVRRERNPGKGQVIRRAFADIEADIYLMVDGDGTYDAAAAPAMVHKLLHDQLDMVVAARRHETDAAYRFGHQTGNALFSTAFRLFFDPQITDVLSGYRVFSRRFVKSFPSVAKGFEIEVEISAHAASMRVPTDEFDVTYVDRAAGTESKLRTYRDGLRIFGSMLSFLHAHRPTVLYAPLALAMALFSLTIGLPVVAEYFATGLVPRFPTAIAAASIMLGALLVGAIGIVQRKMARYHTEQKRLVYLSLRSASQGPQR